jgi:ferredoxin
MFDLPWKDPSMRVAVDWGLCESNAVCEGIAPHVFSVGDDDLLTVLVEEVDAVDLPLIESAVLACPKQALRLVESRADTAPVNRP